MAVTQKERAEQDGELEALLVRVPKTMRDDVRRRANEEERTMAQVVRRALRMYLETSPV